MARDPLPRELSARAELYLCLARAFMAPAAPPHAAAMREALAPELAELAGELGLRVEPPLALLRAEAARMPGDASWLQVYSALFLVPPPAARINAGYYLDGAMNGGSVRGMEAAYLRCGLARDPEFRDLADHVGVQLEFAGWLFAREAAAAAGEDCAPPVAPGLFLHAYARRWVGAFRADLATARDACELPANPWAPLAEILEQAVECHESAPLADAAAERRRHAIEAARAKRAVRGITEQDLANMRRKLAARGLATDHVPRTLDAVSERLHAASGHA